MLDIFKQSMIIYLLLTLLTGVAYPLAVTAIAQIAFPAKANGSLLTDKATGKTIGSELLGQEFSEPKYFWGRLSATTPAYNAAASSGSNLGPTNPTLIKNAQTRVDELKKFASVGETIPVDLVTSSASGLDPNISIRSARYQVKRVAEARGMEKSQLLNLVNKNIENKQFGCLGEARINVLKLNIALDEMEHQLSGTMLGSQ